MAKVRLFYLGDKFYVESGFNMSSLYDIDTKERWDWGQVKVFLGNGHDVMIRPAVKEERCWAEDYLAGIKSRKAKEKENEEDIRSN